MGKHAVCLCVGTISDFPHSGHWAERFTVCSAHVALTAFLPYRSYPLCLLLETSPPELPWFLSRLWDQDILPPQPPGTHLTLALPSFLLHRSSCRASCQRSLGKTTGWREGPGAPSSKCIDKANSIQWPNFYLHKDFAGNVGQCLSDTCIITLIF